MSFLMRTKEYGEGHCTSHSNSKYLRTRTLCFVHVQTEENCPESTQEPQLELDGKIAQRTREELLQASIFLFVEVNKLNSHTDVLL